MLKSDVCLLYNSDSNYPCCSKTHRFRNGRNQCDVEQVLSKKKCRRYSNRDTRMQAVNAVLEYLGGSSPNDNQGPFYRAFNTAWYKATTNGHDNLKPLRRMCWCHALSRYCLLRDRGMMCLRDWLPTSFNPLVQTSLNNTNSFFKIKLLTPISNGRKD